MSLQEWKQYGELKLKISQLLLLLMTKGMTFLRNGTWNKAVHSQFCCYIIVIILCIVAISVHSSLIMFILSYSYLKEKQFSPFRVHTPLFI